MSPIIVALLALTIGAALILGLLAVPVRLRLSLSRADRFRAEWRVIWLFGLVDAAPGRWTPAEPRETPADASPPAAANRRARRRGAGGRAMLAALRARGFLPRAGRLLRDLIRRVRFDQFSLRARYGFDDPADTGVLCGLMCPVLAATEASGLDVRCEPDFDGATLEGAFTTTLRVVPLRLVGTVTRFLVSPPMFRAMRAWRAHR